MNNLRLLPVVAVAVALGGCRAGYLPDDMSAPNAGAGSPDTRYEPRTDLMAIKIPDGAPVHWHAAGYPPLRSARLFPDTPDRDLAADLRKQFGKTVLDPLRYEQDVWMPAQADRVARLTGKSFGMPAVPTVRIPEWNDVVASAIVRFDPESSFGDNLKEVQKKLGRFKWADWRADWEAAVAAKAELKLDDTTLARGAVVYRRWCMQCHGSSGAGVAAQATVNGPMPRDFRQGVFKYITAFPPSTAKKKGLGASGKARRVDLMRTVRAGIDGTIMPAFPSLTEQQLDDVVSYVIHLSVRGETEFATIWKIIKPADDDPLFVGAEVNWLFMRNELFVLMNWGIAAEHPISIPPETETTSEQRMQSALRGYRLYNSSEFGCASCHANYGRVPQLKWDAWGTIVQPRNLVHGVYRGGNRGEDLYARIYGGIPPSGMTAFGDRVAKHAPGEPDKIWDIVHFLHALSDPYHRKRLKALDPTVKLEP